MRRPKWKDSCAVTLLVFWAGYLVWVAWGNDLLMFAFAVNILGPLALWWLVFRRMPMLLKVYETGYRRGRKDSAELLVEMGLELDRIADEDSEKEN